jgi:hypothetical protein
VLWIITASNTKVSGAEFDEMRGFLAKIIMKHYNCGEVDPEKLKAIVLDRARYYGLIQ